jgi:hypothetical protein
LVTPITESINSVLKLKAQWQIQTLPELHQIIKKIHTAQELEVRRALFKTGEYQLAPHMPGNMAVDRGVWANKSDAQKDALVDQFYKGPRRKSKTVKSQDGEFEMPSVPSVARKPGSRRRPRSDRTRTNK